MALDVTTITIDKSENTYFSKLDTQILQRKWKQPIYQVRSILDYDIDIHPLPYEEQTYTALNMNYSVAGFQVIENTLFFKLTSRISNHED